MVLIIQVIRTALLPLFVYWTLLLDTWYWRGVPRRKRLNERALQLAASTSSSTHPEAAGGLGRWLAQPRYPPQDPANDHLQQLLHDVSDLVIDHAFLSIDYESLLGRGASASVFHGTLTLLSWTGGTRLMFHTNEEGKDKARSVEVAVKIYTPPELNEEAILAIKEEMSAWGELSKIASKSFHVDDSRRDEEDAVLLTNRPPNLVKFFGMCVMPPHLSLVFDYCEGGALSEWINHRASLPPVMQTRWKIVYHCALAVHFLHSNGFIHRDLKSANFLLKRGVALLTDFGTCIPTTNQRTYYCNGMELRNAVIRGSTVGTVDHMAPELLFENDSGGRMYSMLPMCTR